MNEIELQNLVAGIVRRVLQERGVQVGPRNSELETAPAGRVLVAICCDECLNPDATAALDELRAARFQLTQPEAAAFKKRAERERLVGENDVVLMPALGDDDAAKMALGIFDEPVARVALSAIALGKPLIGAMHSPYYGLLQKRSPLLARMFDSYRQALQSHGFEIVQPAQIKATVQARCAPQLNGAPSNALAGNGQKSLVTARDVEEAARNGQRLQLPPGALITPLARDRARELGLKID